jgi:hypothetical protein
MISRLRRLNDTCDIEEICNGDASDANATSAPRGLEPLFYVEIKLDEREITPTMEASILIPEFNLKPKGESEVKDWDPLAHLIIDVPEEEGAE